MNDNLYINASNEIETPIFLADIVMDRFCCKCEKRKVYCKGMCNACYSKMLRNTEKGRARMIAYNLTKGKEAQLRHRERNKANKPPKPPKKKCDCGNNAISKNLCNTCYQRLYQREKYGRKRINKKRKTFEEKETIKRKIFDEKETVRGTKRQRLYLRFNETKEKRAEAKKIAYKDFYEDKAKTEMLESKSIKNYNHRKQTNVNNLIDYWLKFERETIKKYNL